MKIVVVNKTPFNSTTYENVVSIVYSSGNVVITQSNNTTHTFVFSQVKIMIV